MANTFYNPKNQYGELLISKKDAITIINNTAGDINNRIDSEVDELNTLISDTEKQLVEKISTTKKEVTDHIIKVDEKHSLIIEEVLASEGVDPHEHFRITIEGRWENAIASGTLKEFAWKLAKTVFLIKNSPVQCDCSTACACDDTYEEFICINPTKITESEKPRFTRLGAVDSILATTKLPGSSILVSDIYHTQDWDNFTNNDKPVAGISVAPIALRDFVHADTAISTRLDVRSAEIQKDIDAINDNLGHIRTELDGTIAEDGISGSRLDIIERVIGINGCCDNKETCSNKNHDTTCEYCEPDCNIFCKINDINIRLEDNDRNDRELSAALEETNSNLDELSESTDDRFDETHSTINTKVEEINTSIDATNESLGSAHSRIDSLKKEHDALVEANRKEHNEIIGIIGANKAETVAKFYELDKVDAAQNIKIGRIEDKIEREINDRIILAGQYSDLNNRINDLYTDCVSLRSDIDSHTATADIKHTELAADISKNAENLEIAKVKNANEHSIFTTNIEITRENLSALQSVVTANNEYTQAEINSLRKRSTDSEREISELIRITSDNAKDIADNKSRIDYIETRIADTDARLTKSISDTDIRLAKSISDTQINCKEYTDEKVLTINERIIVLENNHNKFAAQNEIDHSSIIATVTSNMGENTVRFNTLDKNVSENTAKLFSLEDKIDREIIDRVAFTEQYSKLDDNLKGLAAKHDDFEVSFNQYKSDHNAQLTDLRNNITSTTTEISILKGNNELEHEEYERNISTINNKLAEIKTEIDNNISETTIAISELNNKVGVHDHDILTLNNKIESIDELAAKINSLTAEDSGIITRLNTAENSINNIDIKASNNAAAIRNLTRDTDITKGDIENIKKDIDTLNTNIDAREGTITIMAKTILTNGKVTIPTEKILNRISRGEEAYWMVTVNAVYECSETNINKIIYPEIICTPASIEIIFAENDSIDRNILISFNAINTTTNDIITL